ncbi:hypothetical protein BT96DRAFT_917767 [Gymnopus androsaceus JB14]|uniref:Uncharacterized protein n=1 Tax=Gymnopus androsaceus JB14 TaxID=1447944 RepID=A0A6A4HY66_9AGAR|nr:hypothetical protein BT96DRAFT_917767 [Gymnopus androsaceus JB14]
MVPSILRSAIALSAVSLASAVSPGFPYGSEKVRGVNLGGWLVLEPGLRLRCLTTLLGRTRLFLQ